MKKLFFTAVCMTFFGIVSVNLFAGGKTEKNMEGKVAVAATFDAMKELTEIVGKDKVYVHTIIPPGVEAHDFEPKAGDLKFLMKAKAVVYNGFGMEPWLTDALHAVKQDTIKGICASSRIKPIELAAAHHHHHHHHHDTDKHHHEDDHDEHDDDHEAVDPHAWLSLESAKVMVKNIADGLSDIDPVNAAFYKGNAEAFIAEADTLLAKYRSDFAKVSHRRFVVGHAAFGYLCRDFNLEQSSVRDVFSTSEPSAQQLAKLADYCNQYGKEVGASVQTIYTIESAENGLSYMERMTSNIEKIYKSLAQ